LTALLLNHQYLLLPFMNAATWSVVWMASCRLMTPPVMCSVRPMIIPPIPGMVTPIAP
jgi:hypothetical protein